MSLKSIFRYKKTGVILCCACLFCANNLKAQRNDAEHFSYNVISHALFSGIGSMINKPKEEDTFKAFLKGVKAGAIGGAMIYGSKKLIHQYAKSGDITYSWGSKILNAAGNSIVYNGAQHYPAFDYWFITLGFNRFELDLRNRKSQFKYKLMPFSFIEFIDLSFKYQLDFRLTAETGNIIFVGNLHRRSNGYLGLHMLNSIVIDDFYTGSSALRAHEIIHAYQHISFINFDAYLSKPYDNWLNNNHRSIKFIRKWLYNDWGVYLNEKLYGLESYRNNFFEREARFYSE